MQKATAWNASIASGGGRISGFWTPKNLGDGKQLARREAAAGAGVERPRHAGPAERRDGALGRVRARAGDVTPKEADWLKGLGSSLRLIAAMCGVPATLIGDEKAGSLTDAGVDSEVRALYVLTVLPLLGFVLAELSAFLLPPGDRFAVDADQIEALTEDMDEKAKRYALLYEAGLLADGECRVALGYDAEVAENMGERKEQTAPPAFGAPPSPADPPDPVDGEDPPEPKAVRYMKDLSGEGFDSLLKLVA